MFGFLTLSGLNKVLIRESAIEEVISASMIYSVVNMYNPNPKLGDVLQFLDANPTASGFFNDDYTLSIMLIKADVGSGEEKVKALTNMIQDKVHR